MTKAGTLQVTMPSEREIRMTRTFDAPREAVYEALTNPSLVRRKTSTILPAKITRAGE